MNESLAKGYTKQFFNWFQEDFEKKFNKLFAQIINDPYERNYLIHKNNFKKFVTQTRASLKNFHLNSFIGGSSNKPFYLNTGYLLETNRNCSPRGYKELHLYPGTSFFTYSDQDKIKLNEESDSFILKDGDYLVSEHAIKRLYERSDHFDKVDEVSHYSIIKELVFVPLWANFWVHLNNILVDACIMELDDIKNPIIPSPEGLFFCEFIDAPDSKSKLLHVNSFINNNQLSEVQKKIRKDCLAIHKNLENSCLSFWVREMQNIDFLFVQKNIDFRILLYRFNKSFSSNHEALNELGISIKSHKKLINSIKESKQLFWFLSEKLNTLNNYRKFMNR